MSIGNVLVVVGEASTRPEVTLDVAVDLADRENARLTIARTHVQSHAYVWVTPFGCGAAFVDAEAESPEQACRAVAVLARSVPQRIPVTTLVLDQSVQKRLMRLIGEGHFGAVVADEKLLSSCKKLRRLLSAEGVLAVAVNPRAPAPDGSPAVPAGGNVTANGGHGVAVPLGGYISPGAPLPIR